MNHHFGELGDVWKHLPLAEILRLNRPRHYWETHAGSASYPLTETAARRHGVFRVLEHAAGDPELQGCAYLQILQDLPDIYPGSPLLLTKSRKVVPPCAIACPRMCLIAGTSRR